MTPRHGGIIGIDHDGAKETITTFTSDGIFTPHSTQDVSFLCVGGGGCGAGADAGSGGGGAGGFRSSWNNETSGGGASAEAALPLTKGTSYPIKVGDGGIGGASGPTHIPDTLSKVVPSGHPLFISIHPKNANASTIAIATPAMAPQLVLPFFIIYSNLFPVTMTPALVHLLLCNLNEFSNVAIFFKISS